MQLTQREEQFFKAMAGNGSAPVPVSREEQFMADIVSGESSGLNPLTAEERALNGLVGKIGGGGGGGEGDLVLHKVTITLNSSAGETTYEIGFQQILEGADDPLYQGLRNVEGTGLVTSAFSEYVTAGDDPVSVEIYLMEGAYAVVQEMSGSASETGEYTISGNCEVAELYDTYYVKVTGDCEITAAGYTE